MCLQIFLIFWYNVLFSFQSSFEPPLCKHYITSDWSYLHLTSSRISSSSSWPLTLILIRVANKFQSLHCILSQDSSRPQIFCFVQQHQKCQISISALIRWCPSRVLKVKVTSPALSFFLHPFWSSANTASISK